MPSRRFQITGSAVIDKVKISAAAKKALQGIVLNIDDRALRQSLASVNQQIKSIAASYSRIGQTSSAGSGTVAGMLSLATGATKANTALEKQESLFVQVARKASAFRVAAIIINSFVDALTGSVSAFIQFDSSLRDINKIAKLSDSELQNLGSTIIGLAGKYNISAKEGLDAFRTISQLGVGDIGRQLEVFNAALRIAATSTLNTADSIKLLITTSGQAGISIKEAAARIAELSALEDASAVDLKDLADITTKAGTSIAQGFKKASDAMGLFAAIQERTQAGGAVVGTFAKTFIARLSGSNKDVIKTFKDLRISLTDVNNHLKDPIQLLLELKGALRGLGEEEQGDILGKIFGVRQIELGKAALDSLGNEITKSGRAFQLAEVSSKGYISQLFKIGEEQKKFESQITRLKNGFLEFLAASSSDTISPILTKVLSIAEAIGKAFVDAGGSVKAFLGPLLAATGAFTLNGLFRTRQDGTLVKDKFGGNVFNRRNEALQEGPLGHNRFFRPNSYAELRSAIGGRPGIISSDRIGLAQGDKVAFERFANIVGPALRNAIQQSATNPEVLDAIKVKINKIPRISGETTPLFESSSQGEFRPNGVRRAQKIPKRFANLNIPQGRYEPANFSPLTSIAPLTNILGKEIGLFSKIVSGGRLKMAQFFNSMEAFSKRAIVTGIVFNILGQTISKFTEGSSSPLGQFTHSVADATQVFGSLLSFGPEIALFGTIISKTIETIGAYDNYLKVKTGDLGATAKYLRERGDIGGAQEVEKQDFIKKTRREIKSGELSDETKTLRDNLIQLIDNVSNSLEGVTDPAEKSKEAIARFTDAFRELNQLKPGAVELLPTFLETPNFINKFSDKALANRLSGLTPNIHSLSSAIEVLSTAAGFSSETEIKLAALRKRTAVDSEETIQRQLEDIKLKQDISEALISLTHSERDYYNARRGTDGIAALKEEVELRNILNQKSLSTLQEEVYLEEKKKIASAYARQESLRFSIEEAKNKFEHKTGKPIETDISKISGISTEDRNVLLDLQKEFSQNLATYNTSLKENTEDSIKLEQLKKKLSAAETKTLSDTIAGQAKIAEAERLYHYQALKTVNDLKDNFIKISTSFSEALSVLNEDNIVQKAKLESNLSIKASSERIKSIREEIKFLQNKREQGDKEQIAALSAKLLPKINKQTGQYQGLSEAEISDLRKLGELKSKGSAVSNEEKDKFKQLFEAMSADAQITIDNFAKVLTAERTLARERLNSSATLISKSKELNDSVKQAFETQKNLTDSIKNKIEEGAENIKAKRGDLSNAISNLKSARETYQSAINNAKDGAIEYSLALAKAGVESQKVLGAFFGLKDEAAALSTAFDAAIQSARLIGATEQEITKLRADAAKEQLGIFTKLLDEQRGKAQQYFTSSADDRLNFIQGLSAIQQIVSRFNGDIANFRNLDTNQLNAFGKELISLPQDLRQKISASLEQLPNGVGIGGFSNDQIKEILQGGALGKSDTLGIDSLSTDIATVADLTRQAIELDKSNLIANQTQANQAVVAVEQAKEQVIIAKLFLNQAKNDAIQTQSSINQVVSTLDTQIAVYKDGIKAQIDAIQRSGDSAEVKRSRIADVIAQTNNNISDAVNKVATAVGALKPGDTFGSFSGAQPTGGKAGADLLDITFKALKENNKEFKDSVDGFTVSNNVVASNVGEAAKQLTEIANKMQKISDTAIDNVEIKIDNTQKIDISGLEEAKNEILEAIEARGFVTQQDLDNLRETVDALVAAAISGNPLRPASVLGGK